MSLACRSPRAFSLRLFVSSVLSNNLPAPVPRLIHGSNFHTTAATLQNSWRDTRERNARSAEGEPYSENPHKSPPVKGRVARADTRKDDSFMSRAPARGGRKYYARNDRTKDKEANEWDSGTKEKLPWQVQKFALQAKFAEGYNPRKRLSPDALDGMRALHAQDPDKFSTPVLSEYFKVSPEAIRRILKSKWTPNEEEADDRRQRWNARGEKIWGNLVELGVKPPKKWREMGVGKTEEGRLPKWKDPRTKRGMKINYAGPDSFVDKQKLKEMEGVRELEALSGRGRVG